MGRMKNPEPIGFGSGIIRGRGGRVNRVPAREETVDGLIDAESS